MGEELAGSVAAGLSSAGLASQPCLTCTFEAAGRPMAALSWCLHWEGRGEHNGLTFGSAECHSPDFRLWPLDQLCRNL